MFVEKLATFAKDRWFPAFVAALTIALFFAAGAFENHPRMARCCAFRLFLLILNLPDCLRHSICQASPAFDKPLGMEKKS